MSSPHFIEWGEFAPQYLNPAPTRRTGKRLIREGQIPGKIIDDKPWVNLTKFLAEADQVFPVDEDIRDFIF